MLAALLCCVCHCPPPPIHPLHHLCRPDVYIESPGLHRPTWRWWHCDGTRWP